ncbi:XdhC family aldehyde oxidoreductase maturation factor [Desulfovibrio aminophilus]|uniref:XdhC family aldehyde oxidoreductase maturation factor n=1 Tax=Desulfovibrio aminophilus TaxID=81425 RepID=UPI00339AB99B
MQRLLNILNQLLATGEHVVSATIATHEGSTPRSAGSKMLRFADGGMAGTVGGGLVEARVLEATKDVLKTGAPALLSFDLTGEMAAGADMVCGGSLRVFLERIAPEDALLFRELEARLAGGARCLLLTAADGSRSLLTPDGTLGAPLPVDTAREARERGTGILAPVLLECANGTWFMEPWAAPSPLLILGAGHVSRPTAQVAALAGFRVTVLDDRPEFASRERFPWAREVAVLDGFKNCFAGRVPEPDTSVVIVTRGHLFDKTVLGQALRTPAGYIGMIGSRRKRQAVYDQLLKEGFTTADLERVHCPIGLAIEAETPEEIAVSIVAELILARATRRKA